MEVYEQLQDPEKRFVLTNISAFLDNNVEGQTNLDQADLVSVKLK